MAERLTWLGHSTVLVELDDVRLLTDPVLRRRVGHLLRPKEVAASALSGIDAALVSHVHWDHLDLPSLKRLGRAMPLVVPRGAGPLLERRGFSNVTEVEEGAELEFGQVRVRVTHAEHDASRLRIKAPSLGYVFEGARSVYFAGDTDVFDGMAGLAESLDVALLPVAGWGPRLPAGHLDPEGAAKALRLLQPRIAIPIHWGTYRPAHRPLTFADAANRFAARAAEVAPDVEIRILRVGESCSL
jgi:L-ascorbate metabolism protein UlaG (beta-lactamase superfamily)